MRLFIPPPPIPFSLLLSLSLSLSLSHRWFFGRFTKIDAQKQLLNPFNSYGSYLIRESETTPGGYSLSVRDRNEVVYHYKIGYNRNREFFISARRTFKSLQDLVTHYQKYVDGLCVNLKKPCVITGTDVLGQDIDEWQTDRGSVRLDRKLISSEVFETWKGIWNNSTLVAIKILKPQQINAVTVYNLLQVANMMKRLCHPNIVQLYALCSMEEPVYIITEFIKHGSLLEYLCGEGRSLKHPRLIDMAAQVAAGMDYLEQKNIIHRNLAARNILVGEGLICKVGNFDMAREVNEYICDAQSRAEMPFRWLALESILYGRFTIKSDVWSFGIVLYEIITYGQYPYPDRTHNQVLELLQQGYRTLCPPSCPGNLYNIMLHCWRGEPTRRPTFKTLQWELARFLTTND